MLGFWIQPIKNSLNCICYRAKYWEKNFLERDWQIDTVIVFNSDEVDLKFFSFFLFVSDLYSGFIEYGRNE